MSTKAKTDEKAMVESTIFDQDGNEVRAMVPAPKNAMTSYENLIPDNIKPQFIRYNIDKDGGDYVNSSDPNDRTKKIIGAPWGIRESHAWLFPFGSEIVWKCRCTDKRSDTPILNDKLTDNQRIAAISAGAGKQCSTCPKRPLPWKEWKVNEDGKKIPPECTATITIAYYDLVRGIPFTVNYKRTSYSQATNFLRRFLEGLPQLPGNPPIVRPPIWATKAILETTRLKDGRGNWFIPTIKFDGNTEDQAGCIGMVDFITDAREHYAESFGQTVAAEPSKAEAYETGELIIEDIG